MNEGRRCSTWKVAARLVQSEEGERKRIPSTLCDAWPVNCFSLSQETSAKAQNNQVPIKRKRFPTLNALTQKLGPFHKVYRFR